MIDTAKNFFETIFLKFIGSFGNIFSSLDQSLTLHHFIIFALLILFSGFFSAAEIAIFHVKEYQIQDENGKLLKKKYRFFIQIKQRWSFSFPEESRLYLYGIGYLCFFQCCLLSFLFVVFGKTISFFVALLLQIHL